MDKTIDARFVELLPALADIFLEHYDQNAMDNIPPSMKEWRQDVLSNVNPKRVAAANRGDHGRYGGLRYHP